MNSSPEKKKRRVEKWKNCGNILPHLRPRDKVNSAAASDTCSMRRNPVVETESHCAVEDTCSPEEPLEEEQEFTVKLGADVKEHVIKGKIHDNILTALQASKDVSARMDKEKGKKIYLIGKKRIKGCINLGMPLKYMPDGSQFEMKFYNCKKKGGGGKLEYRQYDAKKNCVLFYVAPSAKKYETNEPLARGIIRCKGLLKENCNLCIFAPGKETLKDAICNDGRFISDLKEMDWELMEENKVISNSLKVRGMSNKTFSVYVKTQKQTRPGKNPNNEHIPLASQEQHQQKTPLYIDKTVLAFYPDLKEQSDRMNSFFENAKKQQRTDVFKVYEEVFGKEKKFSILVKALKLQSNRSESVGYIEWGNSEKEGVATCFVLCGRYILTCHHVVRMIVGDGVDEKFWAHRISQLAKVTFSYEDKHPKDNGWFDLEEWFEVSDADLDFAVLQLKEEANSNKIPAGLVQFTSFPPFNGLIYIVGHPGGEAKSVDGCCVVSVMEREQECGRRLQQEKRNECSCLNCGYEDKGKNCIHMYNPRLPEIINNANVVTYDTSFFGGSSGSPVFNKDGNLVALHAAGFKYGGKHKQRSIIEFGYLMKSILSKIEKKHKTFYHSAIFPFMQVATNSSVYDNHCAQDVEMEAVDISESEYN